MSNFQHLYYKILFKVFFITGSFSRKLTTFTAVYSEVAMPVSVDCPDSAILQERKFKQTDEDFPLRNRNLHQHKTELSETMVSSKLVLSNS